MVIHSGTYFWIALDTATGVVTMATAAMHTALRELFQELPRHIHATIDNGSPELAIGPALWVTPVVLEGGYCLIAIWAAIHITRCHLRRAAGENLEVWNGLVAIFWEHPGDWTPATALRDAQHN